MTDTPAPSAAQAAAGTSGQSDNALIISTVLVTFIGYLAVNMPLAILPLYVHTGLGFSAAIAGSVVSLQYVATIVTRAQVGQMADRIGAKRTVMRGVVAIAIGGAIMIAAALMPSAGLSLALLFVSRLALGVAESLIGTGAIAWAIGRTGHHHTARIISWNGIATYSGLAIGAPVGVAFGNGIGFWAVGTAIIAIAIAGWALAVVRPAVPPVTEPRLSSRSVLGHVLTPGAVLALASAGFGTVTTFATLYYNARHWDGAAYCLSALGLGFILARLFFADSINRFGGLRVARISLAVQVAGLVLLSLASAPLLAALAACLSGFGFSLVFPALGVIAVGRVPPASRGAALGLYSVFLDVGLGIAGPCSGWLSGAYGEGVPFLLASALALVGLLVAFVLNTKPRKATS